jgi:hypothetical protein
MLDSLVRVSRRVGRVTDADTADAYTSKRRRRLLNRNELAGTCAKAGADAGSGYPPLDEPYIPVDVYVRIFARYYTIFSGPAFILRAGYGRPYYRTAALDPTTSPASRIGRSANPREMRRTGAT